MAMSENTGQGPLQSMRRSVGQVSGSASLTTLLVGMIFVVLGYMLYYGVWAAILAIWGVALVALGVLAHLVVWWSRR